MARVSPLVLLPPVVFAALAGLFLGGMFRDDPDALPSTFVGRPAPEVTATAFADAAPFDNATLAEPGIKLVNFFASWCAPCRLEHPFLVEIAAQGVPVYGVNRDREVAQGEAFLDEMGDPYAGIVFDPKNEMGIDWGVYGLPETFVIDGDGTVLLRFAGALNEPIYRTRILPAIEAAR